MRCGVLPLPEPGENEEEQEFISRCIPLTLDDQGLDKDDEDDRSQATAICYSQWRAKEGNDSMADKLVAGKMPFDQWVKEKLGLEDKVIAVRDAFYAQFPIPSPPPVEVSAEWVDVWITEPIEDDFIVAQIGGQDDIYRISYEIDDKGNVTFGEPQKGEMAFNPTESGDSPGKKAQKAAPTPRKKEGVVESLRISEVTRTFEFEHKDPEGKKWLVRIIKAGLSGNGNYYSPELLASVETIAVFEGVKVYDNHLSDEEWAEKRGHRAVNSEYMGWIDGVYYEDEALYGHFTVADIILREKMKTVWKADRKDEFGFSIDADVVAEAREMDGQQVKYILKFLDRDSVDVVFDPAAGGRMERMLEHQVNKEGNVTIEELLKALKEMDEAERQTMLAEFVSAPATGDPVPAPATGDPAPAPATGDPAPAPATGDPAPAPATGDPTPAPSDIQSLMMAEATKRMDALDLRLYQMNLKEALADSGLPEKARDFIWEQFKGRVFDMKDVTRAIEAQRGILASVTESGQVKGMGGVRLSAGPVVEMGGFEYALQRMLGVLDDADKGKVPRGLFGLREWYSALTGDDEFVGRVAPHRVTEANVTTSTVTTIIKDTLNKRILDLYESAVEDRWWEAIVTHYDEETIHDVTVGSLYGIGALATVLEGNPYLEATWGDFEETASFTKKGNYIGITLETFMQDNLDKLRNIPIVLNRAFLYTLEDLVSGAFTANSGDGVTLGTTNRNWFNATEGNLGSAVLSYASFNAGQVALMNMLEQGSSRRLGIQAKYLVAGHSLRKMALEIRDTDRDPDAANNPKNVWQGEFEYVKAPPLEANPTYWYLLADPKRVPNIGLHWFRGRQTPELFTADAETTGALFTNDEIRMKVRYWAARSVRDHIGAYGSTP